VQNGRNLLDGRQGLAIDYLDGMSSPVRISIGILRVAGGSLGAGSAVLRWRCFRTSSRTSSCGLGSSATSTSLTVNILTQRFALDYS
jgi:hypothetical protein